MVILIAVISGVVLVLVLFTLGLLLLCRKRCCFCCSREKSVPQTRLKVVTDNSHTSLSSEVLARSRLISQTTKLGAQGVPSCRPFTFEELKEATDDFDSSRFLGEGSLGKLYRGTLENGSSIAIRCLVLSKKFSSQSIRGHLDWMCKLNHPHLLRFLGHCTQASGEYDPAVTILYLVYEYMPNGSYRSHLSESFSEKILTWPDRLAILIEIAKAVHFLHTGVMPGSFNNQLKTNNVLLDEHKIAKLSDYGVSAIIEENEKIETKSETHKSKKMAKREDDVYNFGFILLESLIGPVPTTKGEAFLLNEMTYIWEPRLSAENSESNGANNELAGVFSNCDLQSPTNVFCLNLQQDLPLKTFSGTYNTLLKCSLQQTLNANPTLPRELEG